MSLRLVWGAGGIVSLGLGLVGVVLPLLPTVPFILLAAFCFSRSSDRLHDWLLAHDILGPSIHAWRESGSISARGKRLATVSIASVFLLSLFLGLGAKILVVQAVVLGLVLMFIWTRPTG